ncbi:MAG: UDP-N-acetylglucosamine--N-acetylmuramyl-(pentapeptide) pyrophosphoryl-undecaprenol N-acetylglucosamine transferase [Wolinella sp.]
MNILITGGGTGGHLAIAKALLHELYARGATPYFIGSTRGQDRSWFESEERFSARYFLDSQGVVNKRGFSLISSLFEQLSAMRHARAILKVHSIERVISVGGYSAAPASFAALSLGIPLYIHEQNARIGTLNRILKPFCRRFFSSYLADSYVDYPVRDCFFDSARIRDEIKNVLFLGGSQGASAINSFALKVAPELHRRGVGIAHQCGEREYEKLVYEYGRLGISVDLFAFDKNLHERMHVADLAISRAGASTLWELCANALPCLFVPYPYAASDHQYHNARFIIERELGFLVREGELDDNVLLRILDENLYERSNRLARSIKRGASAQIVDFILS